MLVATEVASKPLNSIAADGALVSYSSHSRDISDKGIIPNLRTDVNTSAKCNPHAAAKSYTGEKMAKYKIRVDNRIVPHCAKLIGIGRAVAVAADGDGYTFDR